MQCCTAVGALGKIGFLLPHLMDIHEDLAPRTRVHRMVNNEHADITLVHHGPKNKTRKHNKTKRVMYSSINNVNYLNNDTWCYFVFFISTILYERKKCLFHQGLLCRVKGSYAPKRFFFLKGKTLVCVILQRRFPCTGTAETKKTSEFQIWPKKKKAAHNMILVVTEQGLRWQVNHKEGRKKTLTGHDRLIHERQGGVMQPGTSRVTVYTRRSITFFFITACPII